jgi:hypothetical protein
MLQKNKKKKDYAVITWYLLGTQAKNVFYPKLFSLTKTQKENKKYKCYFHKMVIHKKNTVHTIQNFQTPHIHTPTLKIHIVIHHLYLEEQQT